jgi:hypothetical protein
MKITSNKSMGFSLKEELKLTIIMIHELERIKIEEQMIEYEAMTCSVCLVELSVVSKAIQLPNPCSHVYHEECIMKWLNRSNTCPMCRPVYGVFPCDIFHLTLYCLCRISSYIESSSSTPQFTHTNNNIKPPKLKLQSFDGCNPVEWIFQADQYFSHYSNDALNRLIRIYCYMMGEALGWYQWMNNNHLLTTWDENVLQLLLEK